MGEHFEKAKNAQMKQGNYITAKQFVRFTYGNTWEEVGHPKNPKQICERWSMQFSINDGKEIVEKYI